MVSVLRPGRRILNIPDIGVQTSRRAVASAAADWWEVPGKTCIAAYEPIGAASLAASYINLATPGTYDAAPGVAPTFNAATGWTFNGSSQYLNTSVVPAWSWTWLLRIANSATSGGGRHGVDLVMVLATYYHFYQNGGGSLFKVGPLSSGVVGMAGKTAYLNSAADGTISAGTSSTAWPIYIGCRNAGGLASNYLATDVLASAIYNTTLDAGEVATVSAAMAAL